MKTHTISDDAKRIIAHLSTTADPAQRTRAALMTVCGIDSLSHFDALMRALIAQGRVRHVPPDSYEPAGAKPVIRETAPLLAPPASPAREVEAGKPARLEPARTALPYDPTTDTARMPSLHPDSHFLRMHKVAAAAAASAISGQPHTVQFTSVYFMLAFLNTRHEMPVPLLDDDVIGREDTADIRLQRDNTVSRRHCRFTVKPDKQRSERMRLHVEDLNSLHGTYVDGARVGPGVQKPLRHGSRLRIGQSTFVVVEIPYTVE
jgi:hypothetical protein